MSEPLLHPHHPTLGAELTHLRRIVADMGELVDAAITQATSGLAERDVSLCARVIADDALVNDRQRELRELSFSLIVNQSPEARELREIIGLLNMSSELERMGDHCVSIAKLARNLADLPPLETYVDVPKMAAYCSDQVRGILAAMVSRDVLQARRIAAGDDRVDRIYHRLFDDLIQMMTEDNTTVFRATNLVFIAHHLERIADRVTNIAEDLVFLELRGHRGARVMTVSEPAEAPKDAPPPAPDAARPHAVELGSRHRYINRHLSWLDFDTRVLELAEDATRRLLERAKFLAISSSNLDEFFQVRVGGLIEQRRAGVAALSPDGMTVDEQLFEIQRRCVDLTARQVRAFRAIVEGLDQDGLHFSNYNALDPGEREYVDSVFEERIFPVLTPLAVDPAHPFPYISDLSLNLAVVVGAPRGSEQRIARVKVPPLLPRFVVMPDGERFVPVEQVIAAHLDRLFPGMRVIGQYPFRVTRNADPALEEEEAEDLRTAVQEYLRRRRRSPQVVRLEIDITMTAEVKGLLMRELELSAEDVYTVDGPLDLSGLWGLYDLNRPDLKERLPAPVIPPSSPSLPPMTARWTSSG